MKDDTSFAVMMILILAIFFIACVCNPTPYEPWAVEDCPVCDGVGYIECRCGEIYDCSACE